ncbi:MAG: hypothetical protein HUU35_11340, partial [Armatimonadetes bacterium]|nr:hypothetical protein [Armatimonadota bacterium]
MANTLYASFADRDQAVKAAGALLDHGVRNDDLSIIAYGEEHEVDAYTSSLASYRASDPVLIDPAVGPATTGNAGSHVGSVSNSDDHTDDTDDGDDAEGSAKHGLSTTSGEDAAAGAAKGAGVGL